MTTKTCTASGKKFVITDEDKTFYAKMGVPIPILCPEERQRRRIAFRNFRSLYQRKCDGTGKSLISMYSSDKPFPVYENEYWWGDNWDPQKYGRDFDFNRPFFEQYADLANEVPRFSTFNVNSENCTYANFSWMSKNCYLVFGCVRDEDCLYGHIVWDSKNCVDNLYAFRCEWCSECIDCIDCYDTHFSTECANCNESYFLHDCRGCNNCFGCTNLRNKQYCWMNQQLTRAAYEKKIAGVTPLSHTTIASGKAWLEQEKKSKCNFPDMFGVKNEDCSGNHLYESKNTHHSFDAKKCEDSKFIYTGYEQFNSYDVSFTGQQTNFVLDSLTIHTAENCAYCHAVNYSNDCYYSEFCFQSNHLFGCNGMRNAKHCILNKSYTEHEYQNLKKKIIAHMTETGEWGEFFPISISPFGYNEAIVQEYFPLTKKEIQARGWQWKKPEDRSKYLGKNFTVPETITEIPDDVCSRILTCEKTNRNYKIQTQELDFYRRVGLPLPKTCPDERHESRMKLRNPRRLHKRKCQQCQSGIQTTFAPERKEKILCEQCYLQTIH